MNLFFSDETSLADWLNALYVIVMEAPIPYLMLYEICLELNLWIGRGLHPSSPSLVTLSLFKDVPQFLHQEAILLILGPFQR